MDDLSAVYVCSNPACPRQGEERRCDLYLRITGAFEVPSLRCTCSPDREMQLVELCGRRIGEPVRPVKAKRVFRVELEWVDNVNGEDCRMSLHHDFPDASRASAMATAFIPAGTPKLPLLDGHEVARSATSVVRLFEVPRT